MQRARPMNPQEYVCWDYHVIVIRTRTKIAISGDGDIDTNIEMTEVLDIDTWVTPYPCPLEVYLEESFPHVTDDLDPQYLPLFRYVIII